MTLLINSKLPNFTLSATGSTSFELKNYLGKQVIIYFYPKDHTPGCTQEGHDFNHLLAQFEAVNTRVFGVSRDSVKSHENFKQKQNYAFDLLSDPDETVCNLFEVIKLKKLYGREYLGIERSTFLIDANGKLHQAWRKIKLKQHANEVFEAASKLHHAAS